MMNLGSLVRDNSEREDQAPAPYGKQSIRRKMRWVYLRKTRTKNIAVRNVVRVIRSIWTGARLWSAVTISRRSCNTHRCRRHQISRKNGRSTKLATHHAGPAGSAYHLSYPGYHLATTRGEQFGISFFNLMSTYLAKRRQHHHVG